MRRAQKLLSGSESLLIDRLGLPVSSTLTKILRDLIREGGKSQGGLRLQLLVESEQGVREQALTLNPGGTLHRRMHPGKEGIERLDHPPAPQLALSGGHGIPHDRLDQPMQRKCVGLCLSLDQREASQYRNDLVKGERLDSERLQLGTEIPCPPQKEFFRDRFRLQQGADL